MSDFDKLQLEYAAKEVKGKRYFIKKEIIEKRKLNITEKDIITLEANQICDNGLGFNKFVGFLAIINGKSVKYIDDKYCCPLFSIQDVIEVV